ncbi:hypothetical protein CPHO_11700 [Corynebacterium phocae]|uniref:Uncharacterized protein n=1 Tax=Corynebacterium phocae TaxID=161895 RepID=A0A1L7D5Q6_9CORY|nr:DUF6474 family protein [Corynebacterium phocae]APT93445.1 hypothetical protein CPHO_11700 [Corynebacterium phocae]KAA8721139.1 hypothetical protein F4V58_11175 [Corynebacterium phocae]
MGLLKTLRKSRSLAKADAKAAKTRAKAEVKAHSAHKARQQKLLAKYERDLLKTEEKGLKARRKHEHKLAKRELDKIKEGHFNAKTIKRYAGAARLAAPLLLPLLYRGITAAREVFEARRAERAGVSKERLAFFSGEGAPLKARVDGIRESLEKLDVPTGFKRDIRERLDEIDAAIDNAEFMEPEQRRRAHSSISGEITNVSMEIHQKV